MLLVLEGFWSLEDQQDHLKPTDLSIFPPVGELGTLQTNNKKSYFKYKINKSKYYINIEYFLIIIFFSYWQAVFYLKKKK